MEMIIPENQRAAFKRVSTSFDKCDYTCDDEDIRIVKLYLLRMAWKINGPFSTCESYG
jgi:hypothetical protein